MTTILQPHEQRVVAELDELRERLMKLRTFIAADKFVSLPEEDRELLIIQENLMDSLAFVLARRIRRFAADGVKGRDDQTFSHQTPMNPSSPKD